MTFVFYLSAAAAVVAALLAITRANAVHALLYFICSLLATAVACSSFSARLLWRHWL